MADTGQVGHNETSESAVAGDPEALEMEDLRAIAKYTDLVSVNCSQKTWYSVQAIFLVFCCEVEWLSFETIVQLACSFLNRILYLPTHVGHRSNRYL